MAGKKSIVIGCDDTHILSVVLNSMKETTSLPHTIISAYRTADLMGIVKAVHPDLIILCFRNNQLALHDFNSFIKQPDIPILCLTKKFESETLRWSRDSIVFTYPLENIHDEDYLSSRIHSIFLLRNETEKRFTGGSFAERAIQGNQYGNNRDLSRYVLELDQKVEVLSRIKNRIAGLYPHVDDPTRAELASIVNSIKMSANDDKLWDDFKLYFERTSPDFLFLIARKHPGLTPKDLKYCCYLKMNMTNDDICHLLSINQESVRTHKYRLKRKMSLSKEHDLRNYLMNVGNEVSGSINSASEN